MIPMSDKKSGHVGVSWHKRHQKWVAYITVNGKQKYLGVFDKIEDAIAARERAELEFPATKKKSRKEIRLETREMEKLLVVFIHLVKHLEQLVIQGLLEAGCK